MRPNRHMIGSMAASAQLEAVNRRHVVIASCDHCGKTKIEGVRGSNDLPDVPKQASKAANSGENAIVAE